MKVINKSAWLIFLLYAFGPAGFLPELRAQLKDPVRKLSVGDTLPPHLLRMLGGEVRPLSDYRGRAVILDFWNTSCVACVASWPKLLNLQQEFGESLRIILVNTTQDEVAIRKFIDKRRELTDVNMNLPMVWGDTVLTRKMFPYSGLPHVVWLDQNGVVAAITGGPELKADNIRALIERKPLKVAAKINNNELIRVDWTKPAFFGGNNTPSPSDTPVWYSFLSKGIPWLFPAIGFLPNGGVVATNGSVRTLYEVAYTNRVHIKGVPIPLLKNQVETDIRDSLRYLAVSNGVVQPEYLYTYQLLGPKGTPVEKIRARFQSELDQMFGLKATWVTRIKPCYVLVRSGSPVTGYREGAASIRVSPTKIDINKLTVAQLISRLENATSYYYSPNQFVDETGYTGLLGRISFEVNVENFSRLSEKLKPYGIEIIEASRQVNVLLISDEDLR